MYVCMHVYMYCKYVCSVTIYCMYVGPIYARSLRLLSATLPQFGADQAQAGQGVIHYEADITLGKDFAICALDLVT